MGDSLQYGDIIFLGLIAVFVILRLRSMLGKGGKADTHDVWKQATRDTASAPSSYPAERPSPKKTPVEEEMVATLQSNPTIAPGLKAIAAADANFSAADFVAGAKTAFEWVVDAFSKGDKDRLRTLLSEERFHHFADAIDARAKEEHKQETTLVSVLSTDITEASLQSSRAHVTVQFTSEQVHLTRDVQGQIVSGDASQLEKVIDVWTFERDTSSRDPNWKIIAT